MTPDRPAPARTKRCATCHEHKALEAFNVRRSAPDGRQPRCRDCCRAWYEANREAHTRSTRERAERARPVYRQRLVEHLLEHPCVDCGETDVRVLEFDHRQGSDKTAEISALIRSLAKWSRIEAEIAKCDVRCANCHRRVTAERGGFWRHVAHVADAERRATTSRERLLRVLMAPQT